MLAVENIVDIRPVSLLIKELTVSAQQVQSKHEKDQLNQEQYANLKRDWIVESVKLLLNDLPSLTPSERNLIDLLMKKQQQQRSDLNKQAGGAEPQDLDEEESKDGGDVEKTIFKSHYEIRNILNHIDCFIIEKKQQTEKESLALLADFQAKVNTMTDLKQITELMEGRKQQIESYQVKVDLYLKQFQAYNYIQNSIHNKLNQSLQDLLAEKSLFKVKTRDILLFQTRPDLSFKERFRWLLPEQMALQGGANEEEIPRVTFISSFRKGIAAMEIQGIGDQREVAHLGAKKYDEKHTSVNILRKEVKTIRLLISSEESKKAAGKFAHFLDQVQLIDSKNNLVAKVDAGGSEGAWKTIQLETGEKIIGFFGELTSDSHTINGLGLVLAQELI